MKLEDAIFRYVMDTEGCYEQAEQLEKEREEIDRHIADGDLYFRKEVPQLHLVRTPKSIRVHTDTEDQENRQAYEENNEDLRSNLSSLYHVLAEFFHGDQGSSGSKTLE